MSPALPSATAILQEIDGVYDGHPWHGPSVRAALRGVNAKRASARAVRGRHTIWELVLHLAYARHVVRRRLEAGRGRRARFPVPLRAAWWPRVPDSTNDAAWTEALALLDDTHRRLRDAILAADATALARVPRGHRHAIARQLIGLALHDAYHAGQIRLLALTAASKA